MKEITLEKPVRDVNGLMKLLQAQDPPFAVMSVAADARRTYVYLDDDEARDPLPLAKEWQDMPELQVSMEGTPGHLGVMEAVANGNDVHVLTIKKMTPAGELLPGNEKLHVAARGAVKLSTQKPRLAEGVTTVEVGPCDKPMETVIRVMDPAGRLAPTSVMLRFVRKKPEPVIEAPSIEPPVLDAPDGAPLVEGSVGTDRPGGIWSTLKRILKI